MNLDSELLLIGILLLALLITAGVITSLVRKGMRANSRSIREIFK